MAKWSLCLNIKTRLKWKDIPTRTWNQIRDLSISFLFLNEMPVSLVLSFTECNADEVLKMSAAGQCISKLPFILADCAG